MIYAVILNWRGADDTIACLESLRTLGAKDLNIVVCDNDSQDDSWIKLESYVNSNEVLNIKLIQTGYNLGYAGGNNIGIKVALSDEKTQFIWLLNNDTKVDARALDKLKEYMVQNPEVGLCGSTLLYMDEPGRIQAVGGFYNSWIGTSKHALGNQIYCAVKCRNVNSNDFDYIVGASMFVRREVFERVGFLAEDYFLYYEEIDFVTRMKRQMSECKIGYAPESLVYHKEGASTGANGRNDKKYNYLADFFLITSRLKYAKKFFPLKRWVVQSTMLLVAINRLRRRQWRSAFLATFLILGKAPEFLKPIVSTRELNLKRLHGNFLDRSK